PSCLRALTLPELDDHVASRLDLGDLVPPNGLLPHLTHDLDDPADTFDVHLVTVAFSHPEWLIAADVEVVPGRDPRELPEHVTGEGVGVCAVRIEIGVADFAATVGRTHRLLRCAFVAGACRVELGDRGEGTDGVTGKVDLGNDDDVALGGIIDDPLVVGLRVEARTPGLPVVPPLSHRRRTRNCRELCVVDRVAVDTALVGDLDPPSLIVTEVQVEAGDLHEGGEVDDA